jgi:hypothetical protein
MSVRDQAASAKATTGRAAGWRLLKVGPKGGRVWISKGGQQYHGPHPPNLLGKPPAVPEPQKVGFAAGPPPPGVSTGDDAHDLALLIASVFNMRELAGKAVLEEEIAEADDDLAGTAWRVARNGSSNAWEAQSAQAQALPYARQGDPLSYAQERVPEGVNFRWRGAPYIGGMYAPILAIDDQPPHVREAIRRGQEDGDRARHNARRRRRRRGEPDVKELLTLLEPHAAFLTLDDHHSAARSWGLLRRHHGKLALHRLAELIRDAAEGLSALNDHGDAAPLRQALARLHHMLMLSGALPKEVRPPNDFARRMEACARAAQERGDRHSARIFRIHC